jgi:hypothetical protein
VNNSGHHARREKRISFKASRLRLLSKKGLFSVPIEKFRSFTQPALELPMRFGRRLIDARANVGFFGGHWFSRQSQNIRSQNSVIASLISATLLAEPRARTAFHSSGGGMASHCLDCQGSISGCL